MAFKSIIGGIKDFLGGGIGKGIVDIVKGRLPAKLSDGEKADIEAAILEGARNHEIALLEHGAQMQSIFDQRVKDLEGTAADLNQFILGKVILFLRGAQRPIWGFIVMVMDWQVFSGQWVIPDDPQMKNAFYIINFLVLGFLFGERAVKNIIPLVSTYLGKNPQK